MLIKEWGSETRKERQSIKQVLSRQPHLFSISFIHSFIVSMGENDIRWKMELEK